MSTLKLLIIFGLAALLIVAPIVRADDDSDDNDDSHDDNDDNDDGTDRSHRRRPVLEQIQLPNGWAPEGVVFGKGAFSRTLFSGSLGTGSVLTANVRTGETNILFEAPADSPRNAIGLSFFAKSSRKGQVLVAGGPSQTIYAYDASTGHEEALLTVPSSAFVNDVDVGFRRRVAVFTDSFVPQIYTAALPLSDDSEVTVVPLVGDLADSFADGQFNSNGIVLLPSEHYAIVVSSFAGNLYRVNVDSGESQLVVLDNNGSVPGGDGLVLASRNKLWVIGNGSVTEVELDRRSGYLSGRVVRSLAPDSIAARFPTTADILGNKLYVANARFDVCPPPTSACPDTEFEIAIVNTN